ncbi:MAG: hypothetical protein G01um101438_140 [Parcubacteria group bacterium Gr01-1014_38]|nr:MAG: hypothetical protein G01um101438_140 [Parcubacteria group bacterium Gr01-1014_38]
MITKEQLVSELDSSFLKVALVDIQRALSENTNLAVFILGVCMIDALAGFYGGKEKLTNDGNADRFKNFARKYLTQYNADDLWEVRNGLLHSYAVEKYSFVNKKSHLHGTLTNGGKLINDENFYNDLKTAYENFKNDILATPEQNAIITNSKKRYSALKLMRIIVEIG